MWPPCRRWRGWAFPSDVEVITPLADNLPSGSAMKPGDVLRTRNGKTIEVLNTDAEGRLVLADALALATESAPDLVVDVATLTGAAKGRARGEGRRGVGEPSLGSWTESSPRRRRRESRYGRCHSIVITGR